jgi:iron complex outermembrane receptor protein
MGIRTYCILFFYFFCTSLFATTTIPAVIVTTNKTEIDPITHAIKTIISKQEIAASGITSLAQTIQELGDVQVHDPSGNGSQAILSMRGFGANASSNTLLLIDGVPYINPDLAPPNLNVISLQDIERIEIIPASESVLYGDQAVGGSINIITRTSVKPTINFSCLAGSFNQRSCDGRLSNHYKKLLYHLGFSTSQTDNYRDHNNYTQDLASGSVMYPYQTGNVKFDFTVFKERLLYPGALTATQVTQNRRQATNNSDLFKDRDGFYHLQQQQAWGTNWRLETDLVRRETHGNGILSSTFTQGRTTNYIRPTLKGVIGRNLITSGIDFENDYYHLNSLFGQTTDTQNKYGIHGLITIPITARLVISGGLRGAQQNNNLTSYTSTSSKSSAIASELNFIFKTSASTKWYLRRAESFRFPKADENAYAPFNIQGLKTQKGVSYETGMNWNIKKLHSTLSIYQLNLVDEIAFDPTQTPQQPFGANINLDPTTRRGIFLSEKYQVNKLLSVTARYDYVNAVFQNGVFAGKRIPLVAKNIFHAAIHYRITDHAQLYTEATYTGNEFVENDNLNTADTLGGYTLFNVNLDYFYKNFKAALRVNNIFNKYYYSYSVYSQSMRDTFFYPAPGRSFTLQLKYFIA